jgi:hypothetical protein
VAFPGRTDETPVRIAGLRADILTRDLPNTKVVVLYINVSEEHAASTFRPNTNLYDDATLKNLNPKEEPLCRVKCLMLCYAMSCNLLLVSFHAPDMEI